MIRTHVLPYFEDEYISFITIPIYFIETALLLTQSPYNSLGQTILDDMVIPPYRVWEPAEYALQWFELEKMLIKDRSEAIRNWVDEQARFDSFERSDKIFAMVPY